VSDILVLVELVDGAPDRLSLEALAVATQLGAKSGVEVHAAVLGDGTAATDAAAGLGLYGVARAHLVDDARLGSYAPAAWASAVRAVMDTLDLDVVIAPGSEIATEVLAHVAARSDAPMAANVVDVTPGDRWRVKRQRWAGSLLEDAWLDGSPHLMTVAAHAVPAMDAMGDAAPATVVHLPADISDADLRARVVGHEEAGGDGVSLADARVVVGGGRGMGSAEAFAMLDDLADLLGGAVGVSRVATSLGWRPHLQQVGQTGTRIAPDLYIACGISGAIQHIVGCKAAKRILAINTDPDAPILSRASYAVIGDVHTVVPAISAEIRRIREG